MFKKLLEIYFWNGSNLLLGVWYYIQGILVKCWEEVELSKVMIQVGGQKGMTNSEGWHEIACISRVLFIKILLDIRIRLIKERS